MTLVSAVLDVDKSHGFTLPFDTSNLRYYADSVFPDAGNTRTEDFSMITNLMQLTKNYILINSF